MSGFQRLSEILPGYMERLFDRVLEARNAPGSEWEALDGSPIGGEV